MKDMPAYPLRRPRRRAVDPARPQMTTQWSGPNKLIVRAPGTEITISINQIDALANPMTHVHVEAQGERYSQGKPWWIEGKPGMRATNVRVICKAPTIEDQVEEDHP